MKKQHAFWNKLKPLNRHLLAASIVSNIVLTGGVMITPAYAQTALQQQRFTIAAGSLESALIQFSVQSGITVSFTPDIVKGQTAAEYTGSYVPEELLSKLLVASGLQSKQLENGSYTLVKRLQQAQASVELETVTVTSSRFGRTMDTLSRSVTTIDKTAIKQQQDMSGNVAEILGKLVPGMAPSSGTLSNSSQTLRGRKVLVLIDGVPMNTNRNVSRDLFNLTASSIESIEVVRGGSSVYGGGAAGGIIHINTVKGEAGPASFETSLSGGSSLTQLDSDSLSGRLDQKVSGKQGAVDYLLSFSGERVQSFYDADGARIAPEPSQGDLMDTDSLDLLGKLGYDFGDQRLQLTASFLDAEQDTDFISDPAVRAFPPGDVQARSLKGLQLDDQTDRQNLILNLDYSKQDLFGSTLNSQIYYRDYETRFSPFDGRPFGSWNNLAQTFLESEVYGGRLTFDTPLFDMAPVDATLLWGADFNHEETAQPATLFDGDAFDSSGGTHFIVTDSERTFVPEIKTESYGVFGQLELFPADWLILRGGVRHEWVDVSFSDYTTLGQGNSIEGGELDYSETSYNFGAVVTLSESIDVYADFSQAFELPDIGLLLRLAPAGFNVDNPNLDPNITDSYEIGIRGTGRKLSASLAGFYSESDKGRIFIENFSVAQDRSREQIYGVEAAMDYSVNDRLSLGGTFTWLKGERENPSGGSDLALDSLRIPPLKLTGYLQYSPYEWWNVRLQALYSGHRNDAFDDGVDRLEVDNYTTVDLLNTLNGRLGTLNVGIENLLNNDYQTVFGQLLRDGQNTSNIPARGAMLRVSYSFQW